LAAAGNKSDTRPPLPLPGCGEEWKENKQKLVGQNKGSLTEHQTKGTGTTTIRIKRKHNTNRTTHRAAPAAEHSRAASEFPPPSSPPTEPSMMACGMEYPALFGQVGSARPAVPLPGFQ